MDANRFDRLTKALGAGASRRTVLKHLAGGALGGAVALHGLEASAHRTTTTTPPPTTTTTTTTTAPPTTTTTTTSIPNTTTTAPPTTTTTTTSIPATTTAPPSTTTTTTTAAPHGNSACAAFCAQTFGDTEAAGQCTAEAAHGGGPCYSCAGPKGQSCATCQTCNNFACTPAVDGTTCDDGNPATCNDTCTAGVCAGVGVGTPCTQPDFHGGAPIGTPGTPCCGGLTCNGLGNAPGVAFTCNQNRRPVAQDLTYFYPWMIDQYDCFPVTLWGYDPDNDAIEFTLVTSPQNGFLTEFISAPGGGFYASAPLGGGSAAAVGGPVGGQTDLISFHSEVAASAAAGGLGPAGGPARFQASQPYKCLNGGPPTGIGNDGGGDPDNKPPTWASDAAQFECAEGTYTSRILCYVTSSGTFTGTDAFMYVATDVFGAQSAPAIATITFLEV